MEATIQELLHPDAENQAPPSFVAPNQLVPLREQVKAAASPDQKREAQKALRQAVNDQVFQLVSWWTQRMITTQAPLIEKMTLFWHGHFATSGDKVRSSYKLWQQNETFRRNALGNFGTLTKTISRDPAMMVYLDLASSKLEHPNENFARELMELFTLGEGNYTEPDIKQSARAFTGYRINPATEQFLFAARQFDAGTKTFLGQTGNWNGDQIIDVILKQPGCAKFMTSKLWRFFAYENPEPELIDGLAATFTHYNYEIRPLLEKIFSSQEFYSERARDAIVKSPVQYTVEAGRTLGVSVPTGRVLINIYRQMGQIPFYPPNVKGWDGGKSWINTATLAFRYQVARQLVIGIKMPPEPQPAASATPSPTMEVMQPLTNVAAQNNGTRLAPLPVEKLISGADRSNPEALLGQLYSHVFQKSPNQQLFDRLLTVAKLKPLPLDDNAIRDLVTLMMTTPNYQVC